ncbi:MAG: methyltransferase [Thermomicrobiales bacterium]|nr:MAG: methyltransferase [Thermomicrobiales bacterium]
MPHNPLGVIQDAQVRSVLTRLHREARTELPGLLFHYLRYLPRLLRGASLPWREMESYYADKYLALEPAQAAFCYLLARLISAKTIVEFGTSYGISTIWLAQAVRESGDPTAKVIGTEIVRAKVARAQSHLDEAGVSGWVDILEGDARESLRSVRIPIDMLLLDGFPPSALPVLRLIEPHLRVGAVVIADNTGTFRRDLEPLVTYLRDPNHGYRSLNVPFKSGTEVAIRCS